MTCEASLTCSPLRAARIGAGWSVAELAEKSGVSDDTIRRIEGRAMRRDPQMRILRKLADALGTTPAVLLGER